MLRLGQLHERTRRRIGLSAFVVLCLVPTIGMLAWGVSRQLPIEASAMEEQLSQLLGLKVTIAAVEHPEPGVLRLRDVVFERPGLEAVDESKPDKANADKDTKAKADKSTPIVARLAELVVDRRCVPGTGRVCQTVSMTGTGLAIDHDELSELVRLCKEAVDLRLGTTPVNLQFAFDRIRLTGKLERAEPILSELLLQDDRLQAELSSVQGQLLTREECQTLGLKGGPRLVVDFRLMDAEEQESRESMRLQVGRRANGCIWFGLNTNSVEIPCRLLGRLLPEFDSFGAEARFCGSFWAESTPDGWAGELPEKNPRHHGMVAKFLNVDLYQLVGQRFSQTIRGRVDVTIDEGSFVADRIQTLRGSVESCESGEIGQPLLAAAVRELGWKTESLYTTGPVTSYDGLWAHFRVEQRGLLIEGGYTAASGQHVLLHHGNRPILWDYRQWLDVSALLRTLAPEAQSHIPAVRSVEHLARRLPAKSK